MKMERSGCNGLVASDCTSNVWGMLPWMTKVKTNFYHTLPIPTIVFGCNNSSGMH